MYSNGRVESKPDADNHLVEFQIFAAILNYLVILLQFLLMDQQQQVTSPVHNN